MVWSARFSPHIFALSLGSKNNVSIRICGREPLLRIRADAKKYGVRSSDWTLIHDPNVMLKTIFPKNSAKNVPAARKGANGRWSFMAFDFCESMADAMIAPMM